MSRAPAGDVIETKPTSNVFTALVAIAFIAELIAFVALYLKFTEVFDKGLF
jgi:hypothetical protein